MKIKRLEFILYFALFACFIGVVYFTLYLYRENFSQIDLVTFSLTLLSLIIALIAFYIALRTYISIDSVNVITKMEGNILENENYVTSLPSLMKEYNSPKLEETEEAIFKKLEERFKNKSNTVLELADNLQYFIDLIVFFPALFNRTSEDSKERYIERMENLLHLIEKKRSEFETINTGNLILIKETVKLIKGVMAYQQLISQKNFNVGSALLEVRGSMLRNSVTRTVYSNYLGLMYNKKAMALIKQELPLNENEDMLSITGLTRIIDNIDLMKGKERELAIIYLRESKRAFQEALDHCQQDVMWHAFIKYNDARTTFFLQLLSSQKDDKSWHEIMEQAIASRSRLNLLINEVLNTEEETPYMLEYFQYQEELARLVNLNILIAEKESKTMTNMDQALIYKGTDLESLSEDQLENLFIDLHQFKNIKEFQRGIIRNISSVKNEI